MQQKVRSRSEPCLQRRQLILHVDTKALYQSTTILYQYTHTASLHSLWISVSEGADVNRLQPRIEGSGRHASLKTRWRTVRLKAVLLHQKRTTIRTTTEKRSGYT